MKKIFKGIILLFLVLAMGTNGLSTVFAASAQSSIDINTERVLELFQRLGIIEEYDNFMDTKPITRGYFALVAARLYNMPFEGNAKEQRYTDVPLYSSYADAIELLTSLGVIDGDGTGAFFENERITALDAVKILTIIAGYGYIADHSGGYPEGYIAAANEAGMLKGIGALDKYLTADGMLILIANMLNAYSVKVDMSKNAPSYSKDKSENLLKKIYDVDIMEGVVTQNSLTAFSSASDIGENHVEITSNGIKHVLYTTEYGGYIGQRMKVYYISDDENIVYAYPVAKKNTVKKIKLTDVYLDESSQSKIEYYDREAKKDKTVKCSASATVIYNRVCYAEGVLDFEKVLKDKKGTIEVIDNDSDNKYDVININAYDSFMVGNVLLDEQKVFSGSNAYGSKTTEYIGDVRTDKYIELDIDPENYDYFSMRFDDGTDATILDIVQNHVMSVAMSSPSASKRSMDIIISNDIRSGKIAAVDVVEGTYYITLASGDRLETTEDVIKNFELSAGKNTSLFLDIFGNVVGAKIIPTGDYRYGLMLKHKYDDHEDAIRITLYTADNEVKDFTVAESFIIDGVKYKSAEAERDRLDTVKTYIKNTQNISIESDPIKEGIYPIRYLANENDELSKLDTPCKDKGESEKDGLIMGPSGDFAALYDYVLCEYNVSKPKFVPVSKDATVIWIEPDGEPIADDKYSYQNSKYDESSLSVEGISSLMSSFEEQSCYIYSIKDDADPDSPFADLVLAVSRPSIKQDSYLLMVDKINGVYDEKEAAVLPMLIGISQGAEKQITVSSNLNSEFTSQKLHRGDVIRYAVDSSGYLSDISVISRYTTDDDGNDVAEIKDYYGGLQINSTNHKRWLYVGYVAERRGELLKIAYGGTGTYSPTPDAGEMSAIERIVYSHPNASTTVTVYDGEKDRVFAGTFDDIKDYIHQGSEASRIIARYDAGNLKEIMVHND